MNKLRPGVLIASALGLLAGAGATPAGPQVAPVEWLLMQIRTGESTNKLDLVQQSLYRLEKIDPDNPQVLAAQIRMALRQGDQAKAQTLLAQLQRVAPNAAATHESEAGLRLITADGRQQLQQARLLATAGHVVEAKAAWDALFHGVFPDVNTELEYWRLVARLPGQQPQAYQQLQALEQRYPGNIGVELQLARMAFDNNQPGAAFTQLRRLANRNGGRDAASELWLQQIQNQPVSERSVASLQQYLQTFTEGDAQQRGAQELARQQKMLADPAYRQRMRGLALVDAGGGAGAIAALSAALQANPHDAELMGAMGQAQARANHRAAAIGWLEKAIQAGQASTQIGKWQSLLQTNRYWLAIDSGDAALKKGEMATAEQYYRRAQALDNRDSWALIGLGDVAQARKNTAQAENFWQQALRLDRSNSTAKSRLLQLRTDALMAEADALAQQGQWHQAADKYRQAMQATPDDIWLAYRLAGALRNGGDEAQGAQVMEAMVQQQPQQPAALYAAALWLASGDRDDAALAMLRRLPAGQWDSNMHDLADRLQQKKVLARGEEALGRIEAMIALKQTTAAHRALQTLPASVAQQSVYSGRRVALAWQNSGDTQRAQQLFDELKIRAAKLAPSQEKALAYRDAARLERQQQQPQRAQKDYQLAMAASGISPDVPQDNEGYTALTRNQPQDEWLKRSIRSDAADLYRQQDTTFMLEQDYSRNKGNGGTSDFTAHTTMLQAETPLADGRSFVRVDHVLVSAGTFSSANGGHSEPFGSCNDANAGGCSRDFTQRDEGTALGVGWHNQRWSADLGTTPLGFATSNWVGGVSWKTDVDDIGLTFSASRRPISSSLLAYAGARDPATHGGKTWGGVVATGGSLGLSYDTGDAHGVWADLSAHQLTGENVADNSRERLMAGYYYKLVNEDNRRATIGLNSMLWHYQKDLSDYTFGQGGYYSPQQYFSLSVPVTYRQRTENWSFDLGGSVSWSQSHTDGQPRYPLNPGFALASNPTSDSSSGTGFGYTLQALVERRITPHWSVGLAMDIQQAKDYTPSHGLIFMRYSMSGWNGDMDMPPQPLTPYADFK
ncbi:cellulose synthase subunit BcsC-related outer membrane protein [Pantoea sp. USHLN256]|uniref:cellulose synthase subunit BcsC-related outer membrane protein n=1 Tax=Pantoea sp. USHLN256 TaxID=3081293 RepID=UPI003017CD65